MSNQGVELSFVVSRKFDLTLLLDKWLDIFGKVSAVNVTISTAVILDH